jgi:hypothetical protein
MEIEIKKKLVADLLEDPECRKEAIILLSKNIKIKDRDSEIREKYKSLKEKLGSANEAKIIIAEEYCTGIKNVERILFPPKHFKYLPAR